MNKPLNGLNIVVTRPAHQAQPICELIEQNGGTAIRFPVLEITDPADVEDLNNTLSRLSEFDMAIFISPNAVQFGLESVVRVGGIDGLKKIQIAAVGQATARALEKQGKRVDIAPEQQFNSEALLALPAMQQVSGKNFLIFRGEGGRELLAETLRQRGAHVEYAECYARNKANSDIELLLQHWAKDKIDIIIVTSNDGLQNLSDMFSERGQSSLINSPLLLVSERTAKLARQLGFTQTPIIAKKASDQDLLQALVQWQQTGCA